MGLVRRVLGEIRLFVTISFIFTTGLLLNCCQCVFLIFSVLGTRGLHDYRMISNRLSWAFGSLLVFLLEKCNRTKIHFSGAEEFWNASNHNSIYICNHVSFCDWAVLLFICYRRGSLGPLRFFAKQALKMLPGVGWAAYLHDYFFLKRSWASDSNQLHSHFQSFITTKNDLSLAMFPEGTFSDHTSRPLVYASQAFAESKGLPKHEYLLVPRTKGFVNSVQELRGLLTEIVDVTIVFVGDDDEFYDEDDKYHKMKSEELLQMRGNQKSLANRKRKKTAQYASYYPLLDAERTIPDVVDMMNNYEPHDIYVHIRTYDVNSLPLDDAGLSTWLHSRWAEKDELLRHFHENGEFPGENYMVPTDAMDLMRFLWLWLAIGAAVAYGLKSVGSLYALIWAIGAVGVMVLGCMVAAFWLKNK